MSIVHRMLAEQ